MGKILARKMWALVVFGALVAASGSRWAVAGAAESHTLFEAARAQYAIGEPQEIRGRVAAVDFQRSRLTVELEEALVKSGAPTEFAFHEWTIIGRAGVRLQLEDLSASADPAVILYEAREGVPTALAVSYDKPAGLLDLSGTIHAINLIAGELAVRPERLLGSEAPMTFGFSEDTLVIRDNQRSYLAHLQAGDQVTMEYLRDTDRPVARFITVKAMAQSRQWSPWGWWRMTPVTPHAPGASGSAPLSQ